MILRDVAVAVVGDSIAAHRCAEILRSLGAAVGDAVDGADVVLGNAADLDGCSTAGRSVVRFSRFGPGDRSAAARLSALGAFHASTESHIGYEREVAALPIAPAGHVSDMDAAQSGALAYLMLRLAGRTDVVDVVGTEVGMGLNRQDIAAQTQADRDGGPDLGPLVSYSIACEDGYIVTHLAPVHRRRWLQLIEQAGPDAPAPTDEQIADPVLIPIMTAWAATRTRAEIEVLGPEAGVPVCGISSLDEVLDDPQLVHRGYFTGAADGRTAAALPFLVNGRRPVPAELSGVVGKGSR